MVFDEQMVLENCKNIQESFGEICVRCNKCGRFNKEKDKSKSEDAK